MALPNLLGKYGITTPSNASGGLPDLISTKYNSFTTPTAAEKALTAQKQLQQVRGDSSLLGIAKNTVTGVGGIIGGIFNDTKNALLTPFTPKAPLTNPLQSVAQTEANTLSKAIQQGADNLTTNIPTIFNDHKTALERGVAIGNIGVGTINAVFGALLSPIQALATVPGLGYAADAINNVFGALGAGGAGLAEQPVNALPVSEQTKAQIRPLVRDIGALTAQMVAGKLGGDALSALTDKSKQLLGLVKEDPLINAQKPPVPDLLSKYGLEAPKPVALEAPQAPKTAPTAELAPKVGEVAPVTYYHATDALNVPSIEKSGFTGQVGDRSQASHGDMAQGTFLYPDKSSADVFAKNFKTPATVETTVSGKIYDANTNTKYGWEDNLQTQEIASNPKIIAQLKKDGYVGVTSTELGTPATFVFDKSAVKVKSPIPKELQSLAKEAQKYKSAEEFAQANLGRIVLRQGKIQKGGAYFTSGEGGSTYYDVLEKNKNAFDIADAKIVSSDTPEMKQVIQDALKLKNNPADTKTLTESLQDGFVNYGMNDNIPSIVQAAKARGYDGIRVWEADSVGSPDSLFIWNTPKAKPLGNLTDFYNKVKGESKVEAPTAGALKPRAGAQKPIVGTGELKARGLAQGIEAKAIETQLTDTFGTLPEYKTVSMADQAARAAEYLTKNPQDALDVAMGRKAPPRNVLPESVLVAVERNAIAESDIATLRDLATNSHLTYEATTMGQRIRTLAERDPTSPVGAIKAVQDARELALKEKGIDLAKEVQKEAPAIKTEVAKASKVNAVPKWEAFIQEITCGY